MHTAKQNNISMLYYHNYSKYFLCEKSCPGPSPGPCPGPGLSPGPGLRPGPGLGPGLGDGNKFLHFCGNLQKLSPRKLIFEQFGCRTSGCGTLDYCTFANVFSTKTIFKQFAKVFQQNKQYNM